MTSWIQNCQICNDGLCIRMENLKKEGHSERAAAEIMQEEAYDSYPELKKEFAAERIRRRYKYHWKEKGKREVGQIVPSWPMCKTCGIRPVDESFDPVNRRNSTPAEHGLCQHCHWEEQKNKKPACRKCDGYIRGEVYGHGLCESCRKKELHEKKRSDVNKKLDVRQKEVDQIPIDTETEDFWTDLIDKFAVITISGNGGIPRGKVGDEKLENIKGFRSQLFTLVDYLDDVIEQSEVRVRVQ